MADFDAKFQEMQKYLPFLKNVIEKLRSSTDQGDDNPRKAQLKKMEVLHDLLKSNGKKLKMETLLKCEGLLIKLHSKMIPFLQTDSEASKSTLTNIEVPSNLSRVSSVEIVDITGPESPPPQQLEEEPPVVIPTERRNSPTDDEKSSSRSSDSRDRHKHCSKHERHHKHHHHHGHGHIHSHQQHDRNHQTRTSDGAQERAGGSATILSRRSAGREISSEMSMNQHDKNRSDPHRNRDPRASTALSHDIYSPEECWDEVESHKRTTKTTITTILTKSPTDGDSPTQKQAYHDTIFNFKKQLPKPNEMFSRVRNPEKDAPSSSMLGVGRSAPISIPVKVPTIPEVLKSPPLSASDISDLLNESDEKSSDKSSIPSISEIGTRRPAKSTNATPNTSHTDISDATAASTLDKVRKKFAIVTQNSPQLRSSPDLLKSPNPVPAPTNDKSSPIQRIALKYHPHPRTERSSVGDVHNTTQPTDPRLNPNRFSSNNANKPIAAASSSSTYNSTLPQDPRLRKAVESNAKSSLYQQTPVTSQAPASSNFNAKSVTPPSRISVVTTTKPTTQQPMRTSHIPSIIDGEVIPPRHSLSPTSYPSAVMDPRQQLGNNMPLNQSKVGIYSRRDFPGNNIQSAYGVAQVSPTIGARESPKVERVVKAQRSKSGYSSEENWDSDEETPAVVQKVAPPVTKVVQQADPRAAPQVDPRPVPQVDPRPVPQIDPRAVPQVDPRAMPQVDPRAVPQIDPRAVPQIDPRAVPQVDPRAVPQVGPRRVVPQAPRAGPQVVPRAGPQIVPRAGPQVVPRAGPRVLPQAAPHVPHINPHNRPYAQPQDGHVESGFRPAKTPLLATPYNRLNTANTVPSHMLNPHMHQHSTGLLPNPNQSKFSALLNDKTERSKYFESKKQKQNEPRTYMEYKQAKARAAAEEAARKAAEETAKLPAETGKDIGEVSEVDSSVLAKLADQTPATSTLDKLYRSTNFSSCDFPKAKTSFKIPKKIVEKVVDKSETETKTNEKEIAKENKTVPEVTEQQQQKKGEAVKKAENATEKNTVGAQVTASAGKKKTDAKEQVPKKDKDEVSEKKETKKKHIKENDKKDGEEINKKSGEKVKKKSISKTQDNSSESAAAANAQPAVQEGEAKLESKANQETNTEIPTTTEPICGASTSSDAVINTDPRLAAASSAKENKDTDKMGDIIKDEAITSAANTEKQKAEQSGLPMSLTKEANNVNKNEINDATPAAEFLKQLESPTKPARILKRRNTMIVRGSLPEVDKEKIFTFKSLVYEDIQGANEEERRKEIDAKLPKMNKSLAEIFQKTDDNCKVSTQNIISGKRRTRTNVNFNEVKRTQEIYRAKRRSEPAKNTAETASTMAVKKNSPKGKKVAKGKLKIDVTEQRSTGSVENLAGAEIEATVKPEIELGAESTEQEADDKKLVPNEVYKLESKSTSVETVEKSSKPSIKIDALMDEDAQKRHLLESFVQDILNPKKDKAQIFSLLSQILSEENLKFVKEIVESTAEKNAAQHEEAIDEVVDEESAVVPSDDVNKSNEDDETKNASGSKALASAAKKHATPKVKGRFKKKNELDRLNEDIRTMFISRGVLTATGRRMCTLVAAVEQATTKDDVKPNAGESAQQATANANELKTAAKIKTTSNSTIQLPKELPRLRKAKVILEPINVKEIQKRVRMQRMANEAKKRANGVETESELVDDDKTGITPPRKMPVLQPHTPIKQSEVEDDDNMDKEDEKPAAKRIKLDIKVVKKIKPGPKCKKPKSALPSDDDGDNASIASEQATEKTENATKKMAILKNTNKEWHSQSKWTKWCMICDTKVTYATTHYKQMHGENYISRLPPDIFEQLKAGSKLSKPFFGVNQKKTMYWSYRCPFCQQHNRTVQSSWIDHFITHTGEYAFECSKCKRSSSKLNTLDNHIKQNCPGATIVRNPTIPTSAVLRAHVCHLCNYMQLHRQNLDSHFVQQHGIAKTKATKLGYTIDLFDTRDVKIVDTLKAVELEAKILNAGLHADEENYGDGENDVDDEKKQALKSLANDEKSNVSLKLNANVKNANESSDDSDDDIPIAKAVQCRKEPAANKTAVDNASKSNVFVPTRDTTESPTMNNIAQSIFKMANETTDINIGGAAAADTAVRGGSSGLAANVASGGVISMAERLSQKFKNIQSGKANVVAVSPTKTTATAITTSATTKHAESSKPSTTKAAYTTNALEKSNVGVITASTTPKKNAPVREQLNSTTNTSLATTTTTASVASTKEKVTTAAKEITNATPMEDDDENWEDIEITESAPSKTSSTATSANSKQSKVRNKNSLHKLNRLYVTNNKLKKSLSITIGTRKKPTNEERKELEAGRAASKENAASSIGEKTLIAASVSKTPTAKRTADAELEKQAEHLVSAAPEGPAPAQHPTHIESNLGFRPLITNLADLLPDSPCNDPIELVPELTPIESLQDLCDVSSILNSDYISTDWQHNILPLNLNNDNSQQVSMQEALDFVQEQQQQCQQNAITTTTTVTNVAAPLAVASIHRIQNIGYSKSGDDNRFKFYCLSENCTFLYSNEAIGLESHFSCEHSQCTWNGYCQSCKAQVEGVADADMDTKLPLSAELNHMRIKHLISTSTPAIASIVKATAITTSAAVTTTAITTKPVTTAISVTPAPIATHVPILPAVGELKQPSASNSPALDEDRPRIKIRRLTGDCLSTTTTTTPTTALDSKSITAFDENAQLVALTNVETPSNTSISTSFLNQIPSTVAEKSNDDVNRHFEDIGTPVTTHSTAPAESTVTTAASSVAASPCQLQIASVVSLKENSVVTKTVTPPPTLQLPVISNVCSLNTRSVTSPVNNSGALWAKHIVEERAELERSAAESMEITRILNDKRRTGENGEQQKAQSNNISESPEPQVVAETLPVGQATSGSYLITQTVSAQYEEGRLGYNISITPNPSARLSRSDSGSSASTSSAIVSTVPQFKCMANGCKYQTRLPLAMGDHLLFHDRQNFSVQREYLRCSQCSYLAEDVDGFLHHTEEKHGMMMRNNSEMETIRDILRNTDSNSSQQSAGGNANKNVAAASKNGNNEMVQTFTQATWESALKEIVAATGVPDSKLFRCTIEDCKTKLTESSYYSHVVYHLTTLGQININTHTYKCPHCTSSFNKPQKIKIHIKTHGVHKYFCYLCTETAVNMDQMYKHFEERHWRTKKLRSTPLPYKATDRQNAFYVLFTSQLSRYEIQQFREKLIAEWQRKKSTSRTNFKPSEIGLLPLTPIFGKDLNCAVCPYKTKVRTNLMRHLQMHTDDNNSGTQHVANVDPVNPVPCLNSSEKHFDKMTNLASSSLVVGSTTGNVATTSANGGSGSGGGGGNAAAALISKVIYDYVPVSKRYTCGISNCQYLTISDEIFRSHLSALHSDILNYNCPHCKEEICKRNLSIERILTHLRFHGPKLYQCDFCGYLHYMRNVVHRHTRQHDVHPPSYVQVIEHDRTKANAAPKPENSTTSAPIAQTVATSDTNKSKGNHKWSCNLCGHKTMTQQQIIAHASAQHSCKHQYQCVHCTFTAAQLVQVMTHIDEKHSGKKREARYVYEQKEEEDNSNNVNTIDTRPLWLRDDPTRVRHIRGILMEDEEESERYRKRLCLDDNDEGAENGDSDESINLNQFGFLCYYCNSQFANPKDLREKHWQASSCNKFNAEKPFRYRICTQLKCPHCLSFVGNSLVLMEHMMAVHRATKYLAADSHATAAGLTCGHCEYRCQTLAQLAQHNARLRHKPLDLKLMSLEQLDKLKTLGTPLTYLQCLTCMELLADEPAFAVHASLVHTSTVNEIKSQTLKNTLIYACPMCQYASQQELAVLRHMIDHYSGFKRCYFCAEPQTTFNGYMQHCYSDHREEIKKFCDIYTYTEISKYLQQLQLIFPNGLTVDLYNLRLTQCLKEYGSKHIKQLYDEIQKTSQQPPIPRLSLGRLVARKSIEAKLAESGATSPAAQEAASASTAAALQLAGNYVKSLGTSFAAQKIMKRRSTVALGRDDTALTRFAIPSPSRDMYVSLSNAKRRKIHQTFGLQPPTSTNAPDNEQINFVSVSDNETAELETETELQPYSFYGKKPEPMDLNKIFIKIAAGDTMETRVNISKFKLLYNITPRVVVTPTDMTKYRKAAAKKRKIIKPCPLSHKIRYS